LEAAVEGQEEGGAGRGDPGWEAAYAALSLLEAFAEAAPAALAWGGGDGDGAASPPRRAWLAAARLALYPHAWVRRASARLVGRALGDPAAGPGLLACPGGAVGGRAAAGLPACRVLARAALTAAQDPSAAGDEGLLSQACKNAVFLAEALYVLDREAGLVPASVCGAGGGGGEAADAAATTAAAAFSDDDEDAATAATPSNRTGLTLLGLCRAAARLADGRPCGGRGAPSSADPEALAQRLAGLRLVAALPARLGPAAIAPYLPTLLTPAFRITEGGAPAPEEAKALTAEVLDAVRSAAGAGPALAGYNAARAAVLAARSARRTAKAVHALVSPEAAAQDRIRKQQRRAVGRKRQMEEVGRRRAAGLPVAKNRRASRREE
jgi:U3 small nucleolar RNA-associated protein 20